MKYSLTILLTLIWALISNAQTFQWAKSMGSTYTDRGTSIDVDTNGNVYTCGFFSGTVDFDPGIGVFNLTTSISTESIFVQKMDNAGNFVNAFNFGIGTPSQITVDQQGNIYITGFFSSTADFDPGVGVYNLTSAGGSDIFIVKFNNSGIFQWAVSLGNTSPDASLSIAIDTNGYVYTTGYFYGTVDFDPGIGVNTMSANGPFSDVFILKLDSNSNFIWAKKCDGTSFDDAQSIALDHLGHLYVTGTYMNTVDFDPSPNTFSLTSSGARDVFVLKLDLAGNFIWAKSIGGLSHDIVYDIATDFAGNNFIAGRFTDSADFNPNMGLYNLYTNGVDDIFILKLDTAGNLSWAKNIGGTGSDYAKSIYVDDVGNVFTTGQFNGTVDFDPGNGIFNLGQPATIQMFILKLDNAGNFGWAKKIGDPGPAQVLVAAIDGDNFGNIFTSGYFSLTIDFDPDAAIYNLTAAGSSDAFVHKYNNCGTTNYASYTACDSIVLFGITYTQSGTYTQLFPNPNGCDSILMMTIQLTPPVNTTLTVSSCEPYTLNGQTYTSSGTYLQTFTSSIGCDSIVTLNLTIQIVNIGITQTGSTLTANANGASYQWLNCEPYSIITGQTQQSFTPNTNGSYAVAITQNGCTDTSDCKIVVGIGIDDYTSNSHLTIYPNPVTEFLRIENEVSFVNAHIIIQNLMGQTLLRQDGISGTQTSIDLRQLSSGLYLLRIEDQEQRIIKTLIKE